LQDPLSTYCLAEAHLSGVTLTANPTAVQL
jgi:hypothetical protein